VTAEELAAQFPDATEEEVAQGLRVAKAVYNRAKAAKAFRNDERKFFNDRYLDQARKVAELEGRASKLQPGYEDISMERLRRQLQERGLDPEDPYLSYKGTPMYGYARTADRLLEEVAGEELKAATTVQTSVARLLDQYEASGTDWTVADLERQLGKTLKGGELEKAVGFGLALDRQRREGVGVQSQAQLQAIQTEREAVADKRLQALQAREEQRLERARVEKERLGAQLAEAKEAEDRAAQARTAYSRARAAGQSPEEARAVMLAAMQPPSPAPEPVEEAAPLSFAMEETTFPAPAPAPAPAPRPAPRVVTRREPAPLPRTAEAVAEAADILAQPTPGMAPPPPRAPAPAPAPAARPDLSSMTDDELTALLEAAQ